MATIISRSARAFHVLEVFQLPLIDVAARIASAAEKATGLPREDVLTEAEFLKATDEWAELESDPETGPEDPWPLLRAHPLDPEQVLYDIWLINTPHIPEVLHGRVITETPQRTTSQRVVDDYIDLLAGAMHLRDLTSQA
ncbi:hypothetical protein ACQEU5_24950 [Marinactinospora thermotolerans]|uniref:hypothetical protein n=1 Tax=Marinactinospora thermotolerans TaxID=531310 RepID=UPI003D8AAD29